MGRRGQVTPTETVQTYAPLWTSRQLWACAVAEQASRLPFALRRLSGRLKARAAFHTHTHVCLPT